MDKQRKRENRLKVQKNSAETAEHRIKKKY